VGVVVIVVDQALRARGSKWRAPILAVAVGLYLPLELSTPVFVGGVLAELADRWHARRNPGQDPEKLKQNGLLFAAGLIAGEAIIGVLIAVPIVISQDADVLAVAQSMRLGQWAGVAGLAVVGWWMFRHATPRRST
jgi:uncharacterized oligopeptide transporter (OPT) family protein